MLDSLTVGVARDRSANRYPTDPPFHPSERFPEIPADSPLSHEHNHAYALVREAFRILGLDAERFGTPSWNPLSGLILPGHTVLMKPNLVRHFHGMGGDLRSVVTHGSVVRAVADYVHLALGDTGRIIVGDAPLQSASFESLVATSGLRELQGFYANRYRRSLEVADFRREEAELNKRLEWKRKRGLEGDPAGYRAVDLGADSLLQPVSEHFARFRVTDYRPSVMPIHHNRRTHEFLIPQSVLDADMLISLPKMKTHRKVGVTAALKNMVGINGNKDWLPHHRVGAPTDGGDEYLRRSFWKQVGRQLNEREDMARSHHTRQIYRLANRVVQRVIRDFCQDPYLEGSWYGNDTLWRTVLDLNRILLYADREGRMQPTVQRKLLIVVDGLIAGEEEGPLEPSERSCGVVVAGLNPVAVDTVIASLMGFDFRKVPLIREAWGIPRYPLCVADPEAVTIRSNVREWDGLRSIPESDHLRFRPPGGWRGRLERDVTPPPAEPPGRPDLRASS